MSRGITIAGALLLAVWLSPVVGRLQASETPNLATAQQIRGWIDDLSSESFIVREDATRDLVRSGEAVIEPLSQALADAEPEVAIRGVYVLRELALSGAEDVETAARDALVRIAHGASRSAASKATATIARLDEIRQERALASLEKLGAEIQYNLQGQIGLRFESVDVAVYIGPEFRGTDKDLEKLHWLGGVQMLSLEGERFTDDSVMGLAGMSELRKLSVKRTKVTHRGLARAANFKQLIELEVFYSPVGDGAVDYLKNFKTADVLKLYGTKITGDAAERLQTALAGVKVDLRKGGFLGVGCEPHVLGCGITHVHPGSAADDADIRPGDVIIRYGMQKVEDFEQLTTLIGDNVAGDEVTLDIWRDGETFTSKLKLGEWE